MNHLTGIRRNPAGRVSFYLSGFAEPDEAGVRAYSLDPSTGRCTLEAEYTSLRNPAYVLCHPRRPVLYAVEEVNPMGGVVALAMDGVALRPLRALPSGGAGPCHLALSPDARFLFVSHYAGGCLTVFALDEDGVPTRVSDFVQHTMSAQDRDGANPVRQERAHVHFALCDGKRVFVNDLGLNRVFIYGWDAVQGKLVDHGERIEFPKGAGPRHLTVSEDGRHLYVLCELNAQVHVFEQDGDGSWRRVQVASTVPDEFTMFADFTYSVGAAIRLVDGHTLYASTRGHNSIAAFRVAEDGRLSERRIFSSEGKTPRDFEVAQGCVIVANQDSGCISVFRRDDRTGAYRLKSQTCHVGQPSCVCLIPARSQGQRMKRM